MTHHRLHVIVYTRCLNVQQFHNDVWTIALVIVYEDYLSVSLRKLVQVHVSSDSFNLQYSYLLKAYVDFPFQMINLKYIVLMTVRLTVVSIFVAHRSSRP